MRARLVRGSWTFPPPLGYLKPSPQMGLRLSSPIPKRADLVTKAFEMYAKGVAGERASGQGEESASRLMSVIW